MGREEQGGANSPLLLAVYQQRPVAIFWFRLYFLIL